MRFITAHVLKTYPFSCPNRDDNNMGKQVVFNGTLRSRISSQCMKRNARIRLQELGIDIGERTVGFRTKYLAEMLSAKLDFIENEKQRNAWAKFGAFLYADMDKKNKDKTSYMVAASKEEINIIANFIKNKFNDDEPPKEDKKYRKSKEYKELVKLLKEKISIDVALHGRMLASANDLGIKGAVSVSHPMGTHTLYDNLDYFTAVDDYKEEVEEKGAGHTDSQSANSACYYLTYTVDVQKLTENLGCDLEEAAKIAIAAVENFALTNPSGKSASMDTNVHPSLVMYIVQNSQPVVLQNAFATPVDTNIVQKSAERLIEFFKSDVLDNKWVDFDGEAFIVHNDNVKLGDVNIPIFNTLKEMSKAALRKLI